MMKESVLEYLAFPLLKTPLNGTVCVHSYKVPNAHCSHKYKWFCSVLTN